MVTDEAELAWRLYLEHCTQGRHHETQRAGVTQYVTAISAAIGTLIGVGGISATDLPMAGLIVALGLFGAFFSAKQYERFRHHMEQAAGFRQYLETSVPALGIAVIRAQAKKKHQAEYPRLEPLRLNRFWVLLHIFVALVGALIFVVVLNRVREAPPNKQMQRTSAAQATDARR
jgi:hypothetical protein